MSEVLHISDEEKNTLFAIVSNIEKEYNGNIDNYSQDLIVTAIEQLLNYSKRFYGRQFITRQKLNSDLLSKFENLENSYFSSKDLSENGLPSIDYLQIS